MSALKGNPGLTKIDELTIETIRFLAADGVQKANSGHPGMPLGTAAAAFSIWTRHMNHNPKNPLWHNRDRFVLSAGHGSMLLYSLLHLSGYDITLDDLKNFRQLGSKTPGHPEYEPEFGVEVTTGPLGQGIANAVGMAMAEKYLKNYFNKDGFNLFDYNIYTICGDGCLQEGVSGEASSLAGHLGLDNLIVIYDDNHITIDGDTSLSFTEDVAKRYEAYGWHVQDIQSDGNDIEAFDKAIENAKNTKGKPSLIKLRTHIGFGAPTLQDSEKSHGAPLGEDEIKEMKKSFGWDPEKTFFVPDEVKEYMRNGAQKGQEKENKWDKMFQAYSEKYPELAKQFMDAAKGAMGNIEAMLPSFEPGEAVATRKASGKILNALMPKLPFVLGGSADLTPSNNTRWADAKDFQKDQYDGRYIRYGVREHAMGSIMNGISVSRMLRPYGGTFLVFSDYMRPAVRVAALSGYPSVFVFTHDSIGLGEDGPTHQPVEHLSSFRAMPGLKVFRPADANETAYAWKYIFENNDGPVALLLTRQGLPTIDQNKYGSAKDTEKGAYAVMKADNPDVVLLASGSEVNVAMCAAAGLEKEGLKAQVVSMPCWELFEEQSRQYKDSVIPPNVKARVGIEAAVELGWSRYLGDKGAFVGLSTFGESGPGKACFVKFGITPENVMQVAKKTIADNS